MKVDVAIVEPKTEGNVGAIARSMANFEASKLYVVNPQCRLGEIGRSRSRHGEDIYKRRVEVESVDDLPGYNATIGTTGVVASSYNLRRSAVLAEDMGPLFEREGDVLFVFGREDHGLSNEELEWCDVVVTVSASPSYSVLNLSHAAGIVLYESWRLRRGEPVKEEMADPAEKEALLGLVGEVLDDLPIKDGKRFVQDVVWKRVLAKSGLSRKELRALFGFLKHVKHEL